MASVQERLQLKRMPLENWSISEQLYLASAVACSGDQNWMSVSRQLKAVCGNNRPSDWFSQKSCAAQYEMLLENVEPTKRKKRNEKDTCQTIVETPIELIVRKLTQERIVELNKLIQDEREEFQKLKHELNGIHNNTYSESQLREMLQQIDNEEKQREREKQKYAHWLKEREERKREMERAAWRTSSHMHQSSSANLHSPALTQHLNQKIKVEEIEIDDPNAKQATSPLLTSLLKSPSAAPNPSPSILHNMPNQTRVSAPTITNLLTGSVANLSSSLSLAQQSGTKIIAAAGTSITSPFSSQLHNQPLTGPPPNDHLIGITQSPSQAAPTLSMLLENKQKENIQKLPLSRIDSQNTISSMEQQSGADTTKTEQNDADFNSAESPIKDEDQQLMEVFNELIPDDIGELADIIFDDIINEEQVAAVSNVVENLDGQDNLDLKNFQSQPHHTSEVAESTTTTETTETPEIKVVPTSVTTCDSTVVATKMEDAFDELKQGKESIPEIKVEKNITSDIEKDDDSDLSNDTPLSELIKQETTAKQQRLQEQTPKTMSSTTEQSDNKPSELELETEHKPEFDGTEKLALNEDKVEDTTDLLDKQTNEKEDLLESTYDVQQNEFELKSKSPDIEEKKRKVDTEMPIDSFESDSNEEKSMENIKRKIESLPELKDSNSSENSQDEKIGKDVESNEDKHEAVEKTPKNDQSDAAFDQIFDKVDVENSTHMVTKSIENIESVTTSNEIIESVSVIDECNDDAATKEEVTEPIESGEAKMCDIEAAEKSDLNEIEKFESMANESCQSENVESTVKEAKEQTPADCTVGENVVEILDDDILDKDEIMQDIEEQEEDNKAEADSSQTETDDVIEIKNVVDDEKLDDTPQDDKVTKNDDSATSTKNEDDEPQTENKEISITPAPTERKVSTDDELFEDAKETLDVEVKPPKPPKPVTPVITCDTDDDSVIEVVKEEKVGVKRDYSRRKKDHSHSEKRLDESTGEDGGSISSRLRLKDRDRSESPFIEEESGEPSAKNKRRYSSTPVIDSLPNSPASSDDREYRSWKKSILLLYNTLAGHRCASIFAKPITDDQAPNYKTVILQPMDLQSFKRSIDSGQIRTTLDFQLYVMRMCYNAIFYNINDDVTCSRAKQMLNDALQQIDEFSVTWKKENEKTLSVSSTTSSVTKSGRGRKSTRLAN